VKRKLTELNFRSGYGSYSTGVVAGKLTRHTVSELQSGWGPTWTQRVTELEEDESRSDDREEERLRSNTGFNQTALLGKGFLQLSRPVGMKKLKRVRLSEIALSDDGSSKALKNKFIHNVLRTVMFPKRTCLVCSRLLKKYQYLGTNEGSPRREAGV